MRLTLTSSAGLLFVYWIGLRLAFGDRSSFDPADVVSALIFVLVGEVVAAVFAVLLGLACVAEQSKVSGTNKNVTGRDDAA
jgi:hypothetical protein